MKMPSEIRSSILKLEVSASFILTLLTYPTTQSSLRAQPLSACPQQCNNHGDCVLGKEDAVFCRCHEGWSGSACSQQCDKTCVYGTCQLAGHVAVCICPIGYHGDDCQHKSYDYDATSFLHMAKLMSQMLMNKALLPLTKDPRARLEEMIQNGSSDCSSSFRCQNGGKCRHGDMGGYRCQCPSSKYTGDFCQFICPHVCMNGGACIRMRKASNTTTSSSSDLVSLSEADVQYGCACPKNYFGRLCQRKGASGSALTRSYLR